MKMILTSQKKKREETYFSTTSTSRHNRDKKIYVCWFVYTIT